jgi:hypothetical protein
MVRYERGRQVFWEAGEIAAFAASGIADLT